MAVDTEGLRSGLDGGDGSADAGCDCYSAVSRSPIRIGLGGRHLEQESVYTVMVPRWGTFLSCPNTEAGLADPPGRAKAPVLAHVGRKRLQRSLQVDFL